MTKEEIIERIKDRLLKNAIQEYNNEVDRCGGLSATSNLYETFSDLDLTQKVV